MKIVRSPTTSSPVGLYGYMEKLDGQHHRCGMLWVITGLGCGRSRVQIPGETPIFEGVSFKWDRLQCWKKNCCHTYSTCLLWQRWQIVPLPPNSMLVLLSIYWIRPNAKHLIYGGGEAIGGFLLFFNVYNFVQCRVGEATFTAKAIKCGNYLFPGL